MGVAAQTTHLEALTALLTEHAPDKVKNIPALMEHYKGNENVLLRKVRKKYGVAEPVLTHGTDLGADSAIYRPVASMKGAESKEEDDDAFEEPTQPTPYLTRNRT